MRTWSSRKPAKTSLPPKKASLPPPVLLAQEKEIQQLIARFESGELHGQNVAQLEVLVRTAVFKSASALVGWLLQKAAERADAGYQTVIGGRCKQSGMFWSKSGAENILALRCIHSSRRLEDFWKYRLKQHAARNGTLPLAA